MEFTKDQQKAIYTRNRNLLVSAAAGSGKTAVLVKRIIEMITDTNQPIDVDQILVVTFTSAAASEMRERIGDAIEKRLEESIDDPVASAHLHRQLTLLSCANIMTVHAFCMKVLKSHYHTIDLDPAFHIGDEYEFTLLKKDVILDLLEEKYQEGSEEFLNFVESYSGSKTDEAIEELILTAYRFAISNPWPKEWLISNVEKLNIQDESKLSESTYYEMMKTIVKMKLSWVKEMMEQAKEICNETMGPAHYLETVRLYQDFADKIISTEMDYTKLWMEFNQFQIPKLSTKRTGFDPVLKEQVKKKLDWTKDTIVSLKEDYFAYTKEQVVEDILGTYKALKVLAQLTIEFMDRYSQVKAEKGLIDFNDIEHMALNVLVMKGENGIEPTAVAESYRDYFTEILIDEYQDSNSVQETILTAISKESLGTPNIFMVGDVKQSIYKFRLAKPELFMSKYDSYTETDSPYQRIDLHQNFRSRKSVIDTVNYVFSQIMTKQLGDVTYDDNAALHLGANYEPDTLNHFSTEMILVHQDEMDEQEETLEQDASLQELEARAIAKRILELVNPQSEVRVMDKKTGRQRPVSYRDIVVLLRTTTGWVETFKEVFEQYSVPVYTDTKTGYFNTLEIRTIMNVLMVIDNPRQDIPLVAVLRSPFVGLNGEELAKIRTQFPDVEMIDGVEQYYESVIEEDELSKKVGKFLSMLKKWRDLAVYMPMDELLSTIYTDTHFYAYTSLLPQGNKRTANLDMLMDRATMYEKTSYRGVFNFIRYMENIQKYDMDFGEASVLSENDDLVKLMSIHKSKGLEFPIVFVAGLGKKFNKTDLYKKVVFHQDFGMGSDYINHEERYRVPTIPKTVITAKLEQELLSEEMRILYVALTRAKEKLILVGTVKKLEKSLEKWSESLSSKSIGQHYLLGAYSFLDFIMPTFMRHPNCKELRKIIEHDESGILDAEFNLDVECIPDYDLISQGSGLEITEDRLQSIKEGLALLKQIVPNEEDPNIKKLNWVYPYASLLDAKVQVSVSDLKRVSSIEPDLVDEAPLIPKFIQKEQGLTSAQKGTAYHKVMFYLDFGLEPTKAIVEKYLDGLLEKNILTEKERPYINASYLMAFLKNPICKRMKQRIDTVKRETPFVMGLPANELYKELELDTKDLMMVQGVIDLYFEEEDGLVLIDYKTDYVKPDEGWILAERYRDQMYYYRRALEQMTGKTVKESYLFALSLSQLIRVS